MSTPDYYRLVVRGQECDVMDVIDALGFGFTMGCAMKYIARAGCKPGVPEADDLRKAIDCIQRRLVSIGEKP